MLKNAPVLLKEILSSILHNLNVPGPDSVVYMLDAKRKCSFLFSDAPEEEGEEVAVCKDLAFHKKYLDEAFSGKQTAYQWFTKIDGTTRYYNTILMPVKTGRTVQYVVGVARDITDIANTLSDGKKGAQVRDGVSRSFAQTLLAIREEERKEISSAIHDELGAAAVVLQSMLAVVEQDISENKNKDALKNVKLLGTKLSGSLDRVKNVVVNMRPPNIDAVGVDGAVQELVHNVSETVKGIDIKFNYKETARDKYVDPQVKIMLYRVVQESLSNIIKHSGATKANIVLENADDNVRLKINDNGKGFDVKGHRSIKNIGLLGMSERVKYLGGKFEIKSTLGKGTEILVICPKVVYIR